MRVHVVVPAGIDDADLPSGGNRYDRRLCSELSRAGWDVHELPAGGDWPRPDALALRSLGAALQALPDGSLVLLDGLVTGPAGGVVVPELARLRSVVLLHLPLADATGPDLVSDPRCEADVLRAADAVLVPSHWTRRRLLELYALDPTRVHAVAPGVDPAPATAPSAGGGRLLVVGAVTPTKGHDVLVQALTRARELPWDCRVAGSHTRDAAFAESVEMALRAADLVDRVELLGVLTPAELEREYARADLLLLPSRTETYGMVLTEALAHGVPVLASAVGGVPEALGSASPEGLPGLLVPPEDPAALARALARWLTDADLRSTARRRALRRRKALPGWPATAARVADVLVHVLDEVAA